MEQLSSCYFCGDALDSSLDEYPLVPDALAPADGDRRTIVLCPTCKRKLDPVVEVVANAVAGADVSADRPETDDADFVGDSDDGGTDAGGDAVNEDDRDTGSTSIIGDTPSTETDSFDGEPTDDAAETRSSPGADIGSTLGDDEDVLRPVGGDSTADDGGTNGSDAGAGAGPDNSRSIGSRDSTARDDAPASNGGSDPGSPDDSDQPRRRTYTSGQRAGGRPTEQDPQDQSGSDTDADGSDRDVTLSRLENTNVMRLLQNREFPVDRDDFVVVASSAYEVQPRHCEKVIDLAVKHDLLREEDGELLAGSNWS